MRISPFRLLLAVILVCAAALAPGCGRRNTGTYRIGVSQCSSDPWRWQTNDEIGREMMFHDNAVYEIRSADDQTDRQIADIRHFIDNGFDLIIVNPTEAEALTPVVEEAFRRGIPVITFDRRIDGDSYTAHLEVDNRAIGREAAEYAATRFPAGTPINILELQGTKTMTPARRRHEGFAEGAAAHPDMHVTASLHADWKPEEAARLTDSVLRAHPEVNLIYAHSDPMAISAAQVAREMGRADVMTLGIDGLRDVGVKAVADRRLSATFLYPTYGYKLVRTAFAILDGEEFIRDEMIPPVSAIDARNADIILQQNELRTEETTKISRLKEMLDDYWSRHSAQTTLLYAAGAILLLLFGVIFLLVRASAVSRRHGRELEESNRRLQEERDKQQELYRQLDEATRSKLMFFTNVSHDLRTPLTLIEGPVDEVAACTQFGQRQRELLGIAARNIRILRRLIDQILDFRKYENGKMNLNPREVHIFRLLKEWTASFAGLASRRDIKLEDGIPDNDLSLAVDVEKFESIFFNLLSNAIKYTPDNGRVDVRAAVDGSRLTISVKDTGRGIGAGDIGSIFDRFYQVERIRPEGSGIGLALTKAFVELHGGEITVASAEGKGSEFTVRIPVRHAGTQAQDAPCAVTQAPEPEAYAMEVESFDDTKPLALVIDDNRDILTLVSTLLGGEYNVVCADNGASGIKLASRYVPDLIICDVMMPGMDGLECCRILKRETPTSHIPVLMLTACSLDEQRAEGYESGADGYMPKPFSAKVLIPRCRNLIENRRRIKDLLCDAPHGAAAPSPAGDRRPVLTGEFADNDFYRKFMEIVTREMSDPALSIDRIAEQTGLGQSQFTRKIKSLTNYTPVELIRKFRLAKARTLLGSTDMTIGETAFAVGFSSQAYFTKCFRDAYGESPTEFRKSLAGE